MAPKRKRDVEAEAAETTEPSARTKRASTRAKTAQSKGAAAPVVELKTAKRTTRAAKQAEDEDAYATSSASRKTATESASKRRGKTSTADDPGTKGTKRNYKAKGTSNDDETPSNPSRSITKPPAPIPALVVPTAGPAPYTTARATKLFEKYADEDDADVMGPEGLEKLCGDAGISMEGVMPLLLAWQLDAKEMGKVTRLEWKKGMDDLKIDTLPVLKTALHDLETLLVMATSCVGDVSSAKTGKHRQSEPPYNQARYRGYAVDVKAAFSKLYNFCFSLAKPEEVRNIDTETAVALWSVILVPQYPIMADIIEFINEKGTYKGVNKDLWSMMREFCMTVSPSLEGYDSEEAWPTMLDDFVAWKQEKRPAEDAMAVDP